MPIELECKLQLANRRELAEKLRSLGACPEPEVFERNWTFDTPGRELLARRTLLRLRTQDDGAKALLTLKRPAAGPAERFKEREEIQIEAGPVDALRQLLAGLGYEEEWYYEKHRQCWHWRDCEVCLDELPQLGAFLEVEGASPESIVGVLIALDLNPEKHIPDTYRGLYAQYCQQSGKPFGPWRFAPEEMKST